MKLDILLGAVCLLGLLESVFSRVIAIPSARSDPDGTQIIKIINDAFANPKIPLAVKIAAAGNLTTITRQSSSCPSCGGSTGTTKNPVDAFFDRVRENNDIHSTGSSRPRPAQRQRPDCRDRFKRRLNERQIECRDGRDGRDHREKRQATYPVLPGDPIRRCCKTIPPKRVVSYSTLASYSCTIPVKTTTRRCTRRVWGICTRRSDITKYISTRTVCTKSIWSTRLADPVCPKSQVKCCFGLVYVHQASFLVADFIQINIIPSCIPRAYLDQLAAILIAAGDDIVSING